MVSTNKEPYSLRMFVNLYIYIFFILSNAIQFGKECNVLTFTLFFEEDDYIYFQFIIFTILIFYNFIYKYSIFNINFKKRNNQYTYYINKNILLLLSLIFTLIILNYYQFNPYLIFIRGLSEDMMMEGGIENIEPIESTNSNVSILLFGQFIRPIPWCTYLIGLIRKIEKKYLFILFTLTLLTVFPLGIARNGAAMYWLPIVILWVHKWIRGRRFLWLAFIGLFFAFPFLDNFRYFSGKIDYNFNLDYLASMNFDASQIFMATLKTKSITNGLQLLGTFLFFIPRFLWPGKPIGSGAYLVESNDGWFTNVSMPFFAEGYINFGFLGIIIFIILLGLSSKYFDLRYWKSYNHGGFFQGYYLLLLGALIFILRGDLMSSFSYTLGVVFSLTFVLLISRKKQLNLKD